MRPEERDLLAHRGFLSPRPVVTNTATLTVGTDMRNPLRKAIVMAVHGLGIHVESQRNVTVGTTIHRPTLSTHNKARITPTS